MPTTEISAAFSAGISRHIGLEFRARTPDYPKIFKVESSNEKFVDVQDWQGYGLPVRKSPGRPVVMGSARQSFGKRYVHETYALGDLITKEDWDDDKYGILHRILPTKGGLMARSFRTCLEVQHFGMFTYYGYVNTPIPAISPDGVSLFNVAHPTSLGNGTLIANRPTVDADLSISTLQAAASNLRSQYATNGVEYTDNKPRILVVNVAQYYLATQIVKGMWENNTADRNQNILKDDNFEVIASPYFKKSGLTGTNNAWFVVGEEHGLHSFMRAPYDVDTDFDIYVKAHVFTADMRFSYGWDTFRGTYGSAGQ